MLGRPSIARPADVLHDGRPAVGVGSATTTLKSNGDPADQVDVIGVDSRVFSVCVLALGRGVHDKKGELGIHAFEMIDHPIADHPQ